MGTIWQSPLVAYPDGERVTLHERQLTSTLRASWQSSPGAM
jgi:hypothetical protein